MKSDLTQGRAAKSIQLLRDVEVNWGDSDPPCVKSFHDDFIVNSSEHTVKKNQQLIFMAPVKKDFKNLVFKTPLSVIRSD